MAASLCAVCSGAMVIRLVEADPSDSAMELRTYECNACSHSQTYSVDSGDSLIGDKPRWRSLDWPISGSRSLRRAH